MIKHENLFMHRNGYCKKEACEAKILSDKKYERTIQRIKKKLEIVLIKCSCDWNSDNACNTCKNIIEIIDTL